MVMIPVGNRTWHNFSLWTFVEVYVRLCISGLLMWRVSETIPESYWIAITIFSLWAWRPLYVQIKHLYYSWRDAKHRAESDALLGADE